MLDASSAAIDLAVQALEQRRAAAARHMRENRTRYGLDLQAVPLSAGEGPPVSVVLAFQTPVGVLAGEIEIPRQRFDLGAFLTFLEQLQ